MDIVTYALCNKKLGGKSPAIIDVSSTSSTVSVNTDSTNGSPLKSVILYGVTTQNGTATPDNPIDIIPLEGYDTMTGAGENVAYSRSENYNPTEDQYYAIQISNNSSTIWVGTSEKISPLFDGDSIDFATGIITRNNGVETLAIADMDNNNNYPGWKGSYSKYNNTSDSVGLLVSNGNRSSVGAQTGRACYIASNGNALYRPYGVLDNRTQSEWQELYPDLVITFVLKLVEAVTENVNINRNLSGINGDLTISSTGDISVQFASDTKSYIDGHSGGVPAVNSVNGKIGDVIIDTADLLRDSDAQGSDFDISDMNGNVILRIVDGNIETKKFDSKNYQNPVEDYSASTTYVAGVTNTLVINQSFSKGDKIYFHLEDNQHNYDFGKYASYYVGNTEIASNRRGSNGYFEHIVAADCESVSITIDGSQYDNGQSLTLHVYKINGEVKPKIITVASDNSGMFTTLKDAVESITDANSITNPYIIEIYPGTYNTLDGYTDYEIFSADIGGGYTQTSFVGLKITDGISLRGMGGANEVILTAGLAKNIWPSAVRDNISTLNIQGSSSIENLSIDAMNLRYCVHDDFNAPINTHEKRILRNLIIRGTNVAYSPYGTAYGAGMTVPRDYLIENCVFDYALGIHSGEGHTFGCNIVIKNCTAHRFYFGDNANSGDAIHNVYMYDCNVDRVELNHTNNVGQHIMLNGNGFENILIKVASDDLYTFDTVSKCLTTFDVGKLVAKNTSGDSLVITNNIAIAYGVVIYKRDNVTGYNYIQRKGYIATNILGLSGLALGDYVTVDESGSVVANGTAANAIGIVTSVDADGVAFIKLLI